ncbi:MAG: hypothetical protein CME70_00530 [Halobacteriovorax sp.]|nr:hypothetical protein [Halobacteriovorax sp.]|tara:strand:- start:57210 stop:58028 length:819 start_codon:yes stop_codon:yes gene_type:complete
MEISLSNSATSREKISIPTVTPPAPRSWKGSQWVWRGRRRDEERVSESSVVSKLSEREVGVLEYINYFGRVDAEFLRNIFFKDGTIAGAKVRLRRVLKSLKEKQLVVESVWLRGRKVYALKNSAKLKKCLKLLQIEYQGPRSFTHSQMDHDLLVCRAFELWMEKLGQKLPFFATERMLKRSNFHFEGSLPDLVFSSDPELKRHYIVEIETSLKSVFRYERKILDFYESNRCLNLVFYCLNSNIKKRISRASKVIAQDQNWLKIRSMEVLNEK